MAAGAQLLGPLFGGVEATAVFSDRGRLQGMLDFETALAHAQAKLGIIPAKAVTAIAAKARAELFDMEDLARATASAGNPAIPMVKRLTALVAADDPEAFAKACELGRGANALADVVVCNPPYVPESTHVSPEVAADPHAAVFSGPGGLDLMPRVLLWAEALGRRGGGVGIEHDDSNGEQVAEMMQRRG